MEYKSSRVEYPTETHTETYMDGNTKVTKTETTQGY